MKWIRIVAATTLVVMSIASTLLAYDWNKNKKGIQSRPSAPASRPAGNSPGRGGVEDADRNQAMSGPPAGFVDWAFPSTNSSTRTAR